MRRWTLSVSETSRGACFLQRQLDESHARAPAINPRMGLDPAARAPVAQVAVRRAGPPPGEARPVLRLAQREAAPLHVCAGGLDRVQRVGSQLELGSRTLAAALFQAGPGDARARSPSLLSLGRTLTRGGHLPPQLRAANPKCEVKANMVDTTTAPRAHLKFGAQWRARTGRRERPPGLPHTVCRAQWTAPIWISRTPPSTRRATS